MESINLKNNVSILYDYCERDYTCFVVSKKCIDKFYILDVIKEDFRDVPYEIAKDKIKKIIESLKQKFS
jgi:hypothetical protein